VRRLQALLTLACFLVASLSSGRVAAAVLCIGAEGHLAIESGDGVCRGDDGARPAEAPREPGLGSGTPCCECTDIPLLAPADIARAATSRAGPIAVVHAAAPPALASRALVPAAPARAVERASRNGASGHLGSLGTVVLRL
jgi:hypothetical protein